MRTVRQARSSANCPLHSAVPRRGGDILRRLPERNDGALPYLREPLTRYFDIRLDTCKDRCFVAECLRSLKAKQQFSTALCTWILRQKQDARLRSFGRGTIS